MLLASRLWGVCLIPTFFLSLVLQLVDDSVCY